MYDNLSKQLKVKGLSINATAAACGIPEATFRGKMTVPDRSFSIDEAIRIRDNLFPELKLTYLFRRDIS